MAETHSSSTRHQPICPHIPAGPGGVGPGDILLTCAADFACRPGGQLWTSTEAG